MANTAAIAQGQQPPHACRQVSDSTIQKLFILPTLVLLMLWNVFPLFYSLFLSFTRYSHSGKLPPLWIGTANYDNLFLERSEGLGCICRHRELCSAVGGGSGLGRLRHGPAAARQIQSQRAANHADSDPNDALAGGGGAVLEVDLQPADRHFQLPDRLLESFDGALFG